METQNSNSTTRKVSPVFLGLVAATLAFGAVCWTEWWGINGTRFAVFGFVMLGWIVSLCLHEFAHARTALWGGDKSVIGRGYLTLNPAKYVQPGLSLWMPLIFLAIGGIGLPGGAVWVNVGAIRTKRQRSLMSLAGPATNVVMGAALSSVVGVLRSFGQDHVFFMSALAYLALLQFTAAIFNLLPIPGLDGFGAIEPFLSRSLLESIRPLRGMSTLLLFMVAFRSNAFQGLVFGNSEKLVHGFGVSRETFYLPWKDARLGASLPDIGRFVFRSVIQLPGLR